MNRMLLRRLVDSLVGVCEQVLCRSFFEEFYDLFHGFLACVVNGFLAHVLP